MIYTEKEVHSAPLLAFFNTPGVKFYALVSQFKKTAVLVHCDKPVRVGNGYFAWDVSSDRGLCATYPYKFGVSPGLRKLFQLEQHAVEVCLVNDLVSLTGEANGWTA